MSDKPTQVAVFLDWQNVYRSARRAFSLDQFPNECGQFSPFQLSRILAAGNGRGRAGNLELVQVHRGLPSPNRDATGYAANRKQAAAWSKESNGRLRVCHRPLRYPHDPSEPPVEKGVDVELALAAVEWAASTGRVSVVFSHDSDLVPVIETIVRLVGPSHVETAAWTAPGYSVRLRGKTPDVHHHAISNEVYQRVEDLTNYAQR